ncbi:MAG: hypothetical protein WKF77_26130 [Planctomycetaceae bacterium]
MTPQTIMQDCNTNSARSVPENPKSLQGIILGHAEYKSTPFDPVSVVGRLLATRRGYTDAGSVQAKVE